MTDSTFQIKATQLRRLVEPVLPFADKGDTLPILEALLFRSHGGHLYALATDRYRIGVQRVAVEVPDGLEFVLSTKSLRALLSLYRANKLHDPELAVTVTDAGLRVTGAGSLGFGADSYTSWPLVPGEYPKVGALLAEAVQAARAGTVAPGAFNAGYLGDFKQAALHSDGVTPVQVWTRENRPALIKVGADFLGVLMPVRFADSGPGLALDEGWSVIAGSPAEKTEAVKP